jgi:multimeric flavodoxin WrbA
MTEYGRDTDGWPDLFKKIAEADILIICSPIWLGQASSECQKTIERLYGHSGELNEKGQYFYYGKV